MTTKRRTSASPRGVGWQVPAPHHLPWLRKIKLVLLTAGTELVTPHRHSAQPEHCVCVREVMPTQGMGAFGCSEYGGCQL